MNIAEMIFRDFGIEVPLINGTGKRNDPFKIAAADKHEYSFLQGRLLTGIGIGRNIFWRYLNKEILNEGGRATEKVLLNIVELTKEQIVTIEEAYYFDVSELDLDNSPSPLPMVDLPSLPFRLPLNLGYLSYRSLTVYENDAPGLGVSAAFNAPGIKATIYIYNSGHDSISNDINHPMVISQFDQANRDIPKTFPQAIAWPDRPFNGAHHSRMYRTDPEGHEVTGVTITTAFNYFWKLRMTWQRDPKSMNSLKTS